MKYRHEIDGLRAVAVLPVILFHAGFGIFGGGYVGVDIFFVISGYLITSIIISELEKERFSIARFYERRARRILPALFVVMLACLPFAYLWMLPSQLKAFAQSLIAVSLFLSNWLFWSEAGYFEAAAELKPLLHTWSLAVEEQYYLLFPIFMLVLWRFGRHRVFWSIVAIAFFSLMLSEWGWRNEPDINFFFTFSRFWELLAGSICAFMTVGKTQRSSHLLSSAGLMLIIYAILVFDGDTPFPSVYALVPVVGTALIILFGGQETWVAKLLSMRPFVGIGLISYSAYLWHQPLFAFARLRSLTEPSQYLMGALAVAALLLAWATWRWIEQPFRRSAKPFMPMRSNVFAASGVVGAALIVTGLAGHIWNGFEWRLNERETQLLATATPSPLRSSCQFQKNSSFSAESSCVYFGEDERVAVYGNSHGAELAYGIAQDLRQIGQSLVQFTISGCKATFGREGSDHCNNFFQSRLDYLLKNKSITHVVLAYRAEAGGLPQASSIISLANFLSDEGKNVILVLQAPTLPADISTFLRVSMLTGAINVESQVRDEWMMLNHHIYAEIDRLNNGVAVVDLADTFCDLEVCYAIKDGGALYFDDHHMSVYGASLAAPRIMKYLAEIEQ
jgi:peptidoglycan/LPS O-acetylase OafA/YrhL